MDNKEISKIKEEHGLSIDFGQAQTSCCSTVNAEGATIQPQNLKI